MTRLRAILSSPLGVACCCAIPLLVLYLATTSPELTWAHSNEDSGDLVTAAWVRGIPHPTGYPWYLLTCKFVMDLLPWGTIAWRAHVYSIINGVAACVFAGLVMRTLAPAIMPGLPVGRTGPWLQATAMWLAGVSLPIWTQSIIAEVYAASLAFIAAMLWVISIWLSQGTESSPGHEETESPPLPPFAQTENPPLLPFPSPSLGEGGMEKPELAAGLELQAAADPGRDVWLTRFALLQGFALTNHLTSIYAGIAGLVVLLWSGHKPSWKIWKQIPLALFAPLSLYGVLMLYSKMQPSLDWTDTEHLGNLLIHATGRQFRFMLLGSDAVQVLNRLIIEMDYTTDAGPFIAFLALGGMVWGLLGAGPQGRAFTLALLTIWLFNIWHICNYAVEDFEAFLLPSALMLQLFAVLGIAGLVTLARWAGASQVMGIAWAWTLIVPLAIGTRNYPYAVIPQPTDPILMREDARAVLPDGALLIERFYGRGFAWWYFRETDPYWKAHKIDIVYVESLRAEWGHTLLERTNPTVVMEHPLTPDEAKVIEGIIADNIDLRPVFTGFIPWQDPDHFGWERAGGLYRVFRLPPPPDPEGKPSVLLSPPEGSAPPTSGLPQSPESWESGASADKSSTRDTP